jgi:hypothetical protein
MSSNDILPAPLSITFSVVSAAQYHVQSLTVHEATHQVHAQLQHGTHTFVSEDIRLGVVHSLEDKVLLGRVSFKYTLDTGARTIIVCATDFGSADGMHLITFLEGTQHSHIARAAAAGFPEDDVSPSRGWNFRTPMTPGADAVFKDMARSANDSLVSALKKARRLTVLERSPFPDLSQEHYLELSRGLGSNKRGWPGKGIESSYGGMVTLNDEDRFVNVIGSTDDFYPKNVTSWISLWEDKTGTKAEGCTSYQFNEYPCSEPNGTALKGGHVVMFGQDREPDKGADGVVFIMPICTQHNNDDDSVMAPVAYDQGVWLDDYLLKDDSE